MSNNTNHLKEIAQLQQRCDKLERMCRALCAQLDRQSRELSSIKAASRDNTYKLARIEHKIRNNES